MIRRALVIAALLASAGAPAFADDGVVPAQPPPMPIARPVVPLDDTRSYGPTAGNYVDVAATSALLFGRGDTVLELSGQIAVGFPPQRVRELRELYQRYHLSDYQLRVRAGGFKTSDAWIGGPLTIAVQRYYPISRLAISPLLYAHVGIEAAIATPWLSGRDLAIPSIVQVLHGVDTELARDGWSLRPIAAYLRGDFVACRSASVELGIEPEAFVPTVGATEYGARFHIAGGLSLGCHGNVSTIAPKIALEYRGRVRMYAADAEPGFGDSIGAAVQFDIGSTMLQLFYTADLGRPMAHYSVIGIRIQVGKAKQP